MKPPVVRGPGSNQHADKPPQVRHERPTGTAGTDGHAAAASDPLASTLRRQPVPDVVAHGRLGDVVDVPVDWLKSVAPQSLAETLHGRTYEERVALRTSIREEGILDPVELGNPRPGVYQLYDGHQRLLIAAASNMDTVPTKLAVGGFNG